jgi:hypothetical protein
LFIDAPAETGKFKKAEPFGKLRVNERGSYKGKRKTRWRRKAAPTHRGTGWSLVPQERFLRLR